MRKKKNEYFVIYRFLIIRMKGDRNMNLLFILSYCPYISSARFSDPVFFYWNFSFFKNIRI